MDYKDTLNLPRTGFPMKADLVAREPERLKKWESEGLYDKIQQLRQNSPKFILHDGPPFANGDVHIGTALNKILKDIIIKYKTLRGYNAPYIPGWDCHGLPIEFKVAQELRKSGNSEPDAATIRKACYSYALKYVEIQKEQFRRLGVLGEWDDPYLTLDKQYEADELRLLADLIEKSFIYRGKKPVYWSIPCRTALAEAEVEYKDHVSQSIYVKFPIIGKPNTYLLIWTTTPWTLPANLAVAYNSTFSYSVVRVNGSEDYVLSTFLISKVAEQCKWEDFVIVRSLTAEHFQDVEYQHPFCNRTGRMYPGDEFVDNETGTGFVHIAPGHGLEDYTLGCRVGLPIYSPVDDNGCFAYTNDLPAEKQMPSHMIGKSILEKHGKSDANDVVLHELRVRNLLVHEANYLHSYPHCWRSKTPVIFRAMDQWFIKVDHVVDGKSFRNLALEAIGKVNWVPDWGKNRIEAAVKARPDWCISRQRAWGVPIPAFYDKNGNPILDARIVRAFAGIVEKEGTNIWFEKPAKELWNLLKPSDWNGAEAEEKSNDTLDVWIDSGSSSRTVLMRREELRRDGSDPLWWQADIYLEGSDQHRGWFQSSLLLSLAANGAAPYKTVLTHGFMVDADREKISKSKQGQGGYEKPQTSEAYVKRYGVDVLRLWVASQDFRNDIVVSEERITKVGEIYRMIRNTLRYQLSNLYDFDPQKDSVPFDKMTGLDRWILEEFSKLEAAVLKAYENCEFHTVFQRVSQFAAVELSAIYHDVIKDRLYTDSADSPRRRSSQTALYTILVNLCQLLGPIIPFTADEAWEYIPHKPSESLFLSVYKPTQFQRSEIERTAWNGLFELRELVLPELEKERQQGNIGKALEAKVIIKGKNPMVFDAKIHLEALRELLNVSQLEIHDSNGEETSILVTKALGNKCERCWHWETDVGSFDQHPTLCGRCVMVITGKNNLNG
ncbi:MAG: isoleucine--tRNA ligase [Verrucomicrobiia bacterium]